MLFFAVSSGDTMAREACLLGTPTIYTGGRDMIMNNPLIEGRDYVKEDGFEAINKKINFILSENNAKNIRQRINNRVLTEWDDTTEVIQKHINDFKKLFARNRLVVYLIKSIFDLLASDILMV